MTIKQLKKMLEAIPPTNPINKARRRDIIALINRMAGGGA